MSLPLLLKQSILLEYGWSYLAIRRNAWTWSHPAWPASQIQPMSTSDAFAAHRRLQKAGNY